MAMGIWLPGGGGGASSDDYTLLRAAVPAGMKAVTADSDDEAMEGTLNADTTLADSQALSGQTFLKWNPQTKLFEKHTGNMVNKGAWNGSVAMNGSITIPAGFHNGSGKVTGPSITNRGNYGGTGNSRGNDTSGKRMWVKVPGGYYNENAQVFLNWSDICSMAGLTADKIKKNVSIMGITGTVEEFKTPSVITDYSGTITGTNSSTGYEQWQGGNNARIQVKSFNGTWAIGRFMTAVNLSGWNYIDLLLSTSRDAIEGGFGISQNPNLSSISLANFIKITPNSTSRQIKLNVAADNGIWYMYLYAKCAANPNQTTTYVTASGVKLMTQ